MSNPKHSWTPYPQPWGHPSSMDGNLMMMLGRIFERTEQTGEQMSQTQEDISEIKERLYLVDQRLSDGGRKMQRHSEQIDTLHQKLTSESNPENDKPKKWSQNIKNAAALLLPLLAAYQTGGLEAVSKAAVQMALSWSGVK